VLIKICGITNLEDALVAVDAGAQALGFNFWPSSRRYIAPGAAREIIAKLPANILTIGVLVNEASPAAAAQLADEAGVRGLQLHGDESPAYCKALQGRFIIKVLGVDQNFEPQTANEYDVYAIMLDVADRKDRGGTGRTIDWSLARRTRELTPKLLLAGGLSPENIAAAIEAVNPYGVDACSALETSPGKKDPQRVRAFIRAACSALNSAGGPTLDCKDGPPWPRYLN